jgi:hypothetical protein
MPIITDVLNPGVVVLLDVVVVVVHTTAMLMFKYQFP